MWYSEIFPKECCRTAVQLETHPTQTGTHFYYLYNVLYYSSQPLPIIFSLFCTCMHKFIHKERESLVQNPHGLGGHGLHCVLIVPLLCCVDYHTNRSQRPPRWVNFAEVQS